MKILGYFFIAFLLAALIYNVTVSLKFTRKISVSAINTYDFDTNNTYDNPSYKGSITVRSKKISEYLFLNNTDASLLTAALGLIIYVLVILLLFGAESIRFKICQSRYIPYLLVLLFCSAAYSWYFTASYLNGSNSGLANFKYRFNYSSGLWLLYLSFISMQVLLKFKQKYKELNLQTELNALSHQ